MSAVETSDDIGAAALAGWRGAPWIAAARLRLHLVLWAAHGWAISLDIIETPSLTRLAAAAIGHLFTLAKGAILRSARSFAKSD